MEELQDAIEDAQYVNAIVTQEDGPRPILPWIVPTDEQLQEWREMVRETEGSTSTTTSTASSSPEPFSMEWTMQSAIGYFLFSAYLKSVRKDYMRINFCEEVLRWNKLRGKPRLEKARRIVTDYLQPLPIIVIMEKNTSSTTSNTTEPNNASSNTSEGGHDDKTSSGGGGGGGGGDRPTSSATTATADESNSLATGQKIYKAPPMTEIDEYDLERPCPNLGMTLEEFNALYDANIRPSTTVCGIGLEGQVRDDILRQMQDMERMRLELRKQRQESRRNMAVLQQQISVRSGMSTNSDDAASTDWSLDVPPAPAPPSTPATVVDTTTIATTTTMTTPNKSITPTRSLNTSSHAEDDASVADQSSRSLINHLLLLRLGGTDGANQEDVRYLPNDLFEKAEALIMESLKRDYWQGFLSSEQYTKWNMFLWNQYRPVVLDDFFVMRVLGRGGFGLVTACKKGTSGKLYAMKIMNKRRIKMKKSEQLALNERQVLAAVESPFVLNLKYSFHSKEDIYLILDLMTGGDLGYHLHQKGRFPKRESQYFAARIMLGLQALHDKQYVYRDLKPENCLLADDGRVKITDLGLATKITPNLHGAAGTRGYWAPEMLRRDQKGKRMNYGHTVDWFSFGCCVAEFICGYNPFRSEAALKFGMEHGHQTKDKAIDCATMEMDPAFDSIYFDPEAADLCRKLLDKNELIRLGHNGCEEIMSHPWFKNVNWETIITDRKKPPFTPPQDVNAASQSEIGTFAEDKDTLIDEKDEEHYKDWDWTNPRAFAAEVIEFLIYERETGEPLVPVPQNPTCCCGIL